MASTSTHNPSSQEAQAPTGDGSSIHQDESRSAQGESYVIAYSGKTDLLLACVPAGCDIHRAIAKAFRRRPDDAPADEDIIIVRDVFLSNDEMAGEIAYSMCPNDRTWLKDAKGAQYCFAVLQRP